MNKANFTFFHLKGSEKIGVRVVSSLFLFFSLLVSTGVSAQTLSCPGHLNVSPDPVTCDAVLSAAELTGVQGATITISGVSSAYLSGNGTGVVTIDAAAIPVFQTRGMVMDLTYSLATASNSCWGTFVLEDKAAPTLNDCGNFVTVNCDEYNEGAWWANVNDAYTARKVNGIDTYAPTATECTNTTYSYSERVSPEMCVGDTIFRTWRVYDVKGNTAVCTDTVVLIPASLIDLEFPPHYDGIDNITRTIAVNITGIGATSIVVGVEEPLACDGADKVWNALPNGYPSPFDSLVKDSKGVTIGTVPGTGIPGGYGDCGTINADYEDLRIDICDAGCAQPSPSFKVVRSWTVMDWCTGDIVEYNQIIKVMDTIAPQFNPIDNVTISTDLWGCGATWKLPASPKSDNCSATSAIKVSYGSSEGTITGVYPNAVLNLPSVAKTMDGEHVELYIYYEDCCSNISVDTVLITVADQVPPVVVADHHTVVSLSQYQGGLAKVFAETFDDGSFDGCGPIDFSVRRMNTTCEGYEIEDGDDENVKGDENWWGEYIHFCCEDVAESPVMVVFRVCDDANMDGIIGNSGDYCNTAMVEVTVQDKLPPACSNLAPKNISCIDFVAYQDLLDVGVLDADGAAKIDAAFGAASGAATCNVLVEQSLSSKENCGRGTVTRTIKVTNTVNGLSTTCTQIINVTADTYVNFLTCDDIGFPEESQEYQVFRDYIRSQKSKYENTIVWDDNVWCLMNPRGIGEFVNDGEDLPAIEGDCDGVTITAPEINIDNLCSEVGISLELDTFDFAGGGCKKILAHWEVIDQCIFDENFLYYNGTKWEINPFVAENGYFEMYVEYDLFDDVAPEITCGEGQTVGCGEDFQGPITASATDNCTDPEFFGWSWKLDVGNDNVYNFSGEGNSVAPGDIIVDGKPLAAFPEGTHRITWIVSDGCGNIASEDCIFGLEVKDEKAPTPYCYDGLSSAVMLMNGVTLWAADFDAGSYDACSDVTVTMIPVEDTEGLTDEEAYDASFNKVLNTQTGKMEYGWNFTCDYIPNGVSATIEVRLYATDASGNYDYCVASFRLQDNLGGCPDVDGALAAIGGNIATESGDMVSGVEVEAMTSNPEFPKYTTSNATGGYAFYSNPTSYSYELSSVKNDDYLNGVTTLDIVLIQKHILNIEKLDSPYKMIAADINSDQIVAASDLLQLRKLILGLYASDRLPSNGSWRFVDAEHQFVNAANPFPFDEVINVVDLSNDMMAENFVAVKVGDVNASAQGSANSNAQVRTNKALTFELNNASYAAGEEVEVEFRSSDFANVFGYQFTLEFSNLTFTGVKAGALEVNEANFGLNRINEGVITTSYDNVRGATVSADDVLFTLTFSANEAGQLKDAVNISSKITTAEAYLGDALEVNNVNVAFRTNEGTELVNGYSLYQNEPNPFKGVTNISFNLPEAAQATLSVYDVTGKVIYRTSANYAKGLNTVKVENLSASGVLYYQLDSNDFTATKKMVVIE